MLKQTSYTLPRETTDQGAGLPRLRAVFFSDYHYPLNSLPIEALFRFIREQAPDVVIFGGDMGNTADDLQGAVFITARIAAFCRDYGIPFVAIRGNHDSTLTVEAAAQAGYPLLINEHFNIQAKDGSFWQLLGLEDIRLGKADPVIALRTPSKLSPALPRTEPFIPAGRRILLAHNPDNILSLTPRDAAFCLSGHFHGGQIRLPGHLEFTMLREEVLCRCGLTDGVLPIQGIWHFISKGYGNVLFPNRLGVRPEVSLLSFSESRSKVPSETNDALIDAYLATNETPLLNQ